jgi:hypothetical protein
MVRRLNDLMHDAGTGGAACRVKTCGSVGGREVKEHDRGHTVGERKTAFGSIKKTFFRGFRQKPVDPPEADESPVVFELSRRG